MLQCTLHSQSVHGGNAGHDPGGLAPPNPKALGSPQSQTQGTLTRRKIMNCNSRYANCNRTLFSALYVAILAAAFAYPLAVLVGA